MSERPTVGSLFSGIGGIDLGLERLGFQVKWFCERDEFCQHVLSAHWPGVTIYSDVALIGEGTPRVDVITAGFPCQPVSIAGRRNAEEDDKWLWPDVERCVRVLRPRFVLLENVTGLLTAGFDDVIGGLAACGYDAEWDCVPAAAVGAPHLRDRVFIIAQLGSEQRRPVADSDNGRPLDPVRSGRDAPRDGGEDVARTPFVQSFTGKWATEPNVGRVANGVPRRMDRLRALGNAVVPQVAEVVGRKLMHAMESESV